MINRQQQLAPHLSAAPAQEAGDFLHPAYRELNRSFRWQVQANFNMAEFCCGRWARGQHAGRVAVIAYEEVRTQTQTYRQLQQAAKQLVRVLRVQGVVQQDLVPIISAGETVAPSESCTWRAVQSPCGACARSRCDNPPC